MIWESSSTPSRPAASTPTWCAIPAPAWPSAAPGEQTLQYEGAALPVSTTSQADAASRELYYRAWPECRDHLAWPTLAYWRLEARWLRFSVYDRGPLIFERRLR
jgi:hypothetical protein